MARALPTGVLALFLGMAVLGAEECFVFWNVANYRIAASDAGPAKTAGARDEIASLLADLSPTILGLAEVADEASLEDLRTRLRKAGHDLPHRILCHADTRGRNLALLSLHPVVRNDSRASVPFDLNGRPRTMARGILDATLQLPGGTLLRCVGLHWKSQMDTPGDDDSAFRAGEARATRQHLDAIPGETSGMRLLVFGDLNDLKNSYPVRELAGAPGSESSLREVIPVDSRGEVWTHHWKEGAVYSRLDYVFTNATLRKSLHSPRIAPDRLAARTSDHRPVSVTLRLP